MVTPPTVIIITTNYLEFHKLSGSLGHNQLIPNERTPYVDSNLLKENKKTNKNKTNKNASRS